ncbi:MAG: tetratricopeptide repeat protein [Thiomonas sp.]
MAQLDSPFAAPRTTATPAQSSVQMPFAAATRTASAASVQASTINPPVMPFGLPPLVDDRPLQPEIDAPPPPSTWGHSGFDWDSRFLQPASPSKQVQVDELMDASQLAEYFIETGDDERAIDLLEKSIDDSASSHYPLPYLLLFDLYRKHGRRQEYEALYQRFGRRFNVAVPSWDEATKASGQGRDLMDYDRAMKLITLAWGEPRSVSVIEQMLLDDPNRHRMGFDLPAYLDLLMLYAVARDLFPDAVPTSVPAEHVELDTRLASATPDLDFELPLVTQPAQASSGEATAEFRLLPQQDETKSGKH